MQKLVYGVLFLLLTATAFAHEGEEFADPGVKADSFLWGLDRALENIKLLLTFDREERIRIGLAIAEERLAEAHYLKEEGQSAHDTLEQYAVALNRARRQLEKYGAEDAKELVLDVDDTLALLDEQVAEFEPQDSVENARKQMNDEVGKRKTSLGIELEPAVEKIESLVSDEAVLNSEILEVIPVESNETDDVNETVQEPVVLLDLEIKAEIEGNATHVIVTGDLDKEFDVAETSLSAITAAIAVELGLTEEEVAEVLTLRDENALQIVVTIEDDDLSRIVVTQNGEVKKITLSIADEAAIIKEVVKRTGLTQEVVEEVIVFTKLEYVELEDPDEEDE